ERRRGASGRRRGRRGRTLASWPRLVLADEPTSALDSKTGREGIDLLVRLAREQRCPVLMGTHDTRIADVTDRGIRMEDGRIVSADGANGRHPGSALRTPPPGAR